MIDFVGILQPLGPIGIIRETVASKGVRGLYAGCTALVVGNAVKAGVRFLSYDQYKSMLTDADVSSHFLGAVAAGFWLSILILWCSG